MLSLQIGKELASRFHASFHFSPPGTTFEREEWVVAAEGVTHLRLWIKPGGNVQFSWQRGRWGRI